MSINNDRKILEGIRAGDAKAIKIFYKKNFSYIKGFVLKNSGNEEDAEDIFQDALIVIYEKLKAGSLDIYSNVTLRTYLYAICKNMWRSRLRKRKKIIIDNEVLKENEGIEVSIGEELDRKEREELYRKYFLTLNTSCREILSLVFDGKNMKEIASITGYSNGYTRKKKFECKKALLERLEKDPIFQELKITSVKD